MAYTIDKVPDMPVVVLVHRTSDPLPEMPAALARLREVLDEQKEPVFLVSDIGRGAMTFDDFVKVANLISRGDKPVLHHKMVRENVLVTDNPMIRLASRGLSSATFGRVKGKVFGSTAEALEYCRGVVAAAAALEHKTAAHPPAISH